MEESLYICLYMVIRLLSHWESGTLHTLFQFLPCFLLHSSFQAVSQKEEERLTVLYSKLESNSGINSNFHMKMRQGKVFAPLHIIVLYFLL